MRIQPPVFRHFPLEPFIISRAFSHLHFLLDAPLGSATFLYNCSPLFLPVFTASSLCITLAPICPWEVHPLASGRGPPICVPSLQEGCLWHHCLLCNSCWAHGAQPFPPPTDPMMENSSSLGKNRWMEWRDGSFFM